MKTVIVFSPHPDDLQIAMGGTVLKLLSEGVKIIEVIFSAGQKSNPHLREDVVIGKRRKQSERASRVMNITETIYFNLEDMDLKNDVHKVDEEIQALLKKYEPSMLYIPSLIDKHPDHQAVSSKIMELTQNKNIKILGYDVWGGDDKRYQRIYINITPYFRQKLRLMKLFTDTEWFSIYLQYLPVILRAIKNGAKIHCRYAERFYVLKW